MSGAPCPPELVARVREQMIPGLIVAYGLTEASPSVTMTRADDGPITATRTVGRPMEGVSLKVIGPQGERLPDGAEGELCVKGCNVMQGYWNDPAATAQALDADGWLHTGDLAVIDADGPVRIVGRKDAVINRGGFKIYPGTVEMVLRSFPGVKEAAVVGVPDVIFGELPAACVVRAPGADFSADDLRVFAAERMADYAVPDRVLFFEALPRRGSGPIQKDILRDRIRIRGKSWKFGKNVDTDAIIPARHCNTADPRELAQHCMEDADPEFIHRMRRGDVIVADTNFGCGSSREVAPISIKSAGVSAVIAKSFARIFFRNSINIGLPILECPAAVDGIQEGDEIEVEPAAGSIRNLTRGETYQAEPFPDFLRRIIDRGGLLAYVEERLAEGQTGQPEQK
jgi:3-isopropylmalate/(R)-2-methylmalate dehydratase small subunit